MKTNEYYYLLLAEECNEIAHRVSKLLRFGSEERQRNQVKTNKERLEDEIIDFYAVIEVLIEKDLIQDKVNLNSIIRKKEKIEKYLSYSKECGMINDRTKT